MTTRKPDRGANARLVELEVADSAEAWSSAGFSVLDDVVTVSAVRIRLSGAHPDRRGILGWSVAGLIAHGNDIDGLATAFVDPIDPPTDGPPHANGTHGMDHIVVLSPDLDRTIAALSAVGLACRRIRDTTSPQGTPMRQAFFKLGPVVVEVVGGDARPDGTPATDPVEAPASWFGLAFDVTDLDRTSDLLGDHLGPVKPAVQTGRRIATLRHRAVGVGVATAFMDHLGSRS